MKSNQKEGIGDDPKGDVHSDAFHKIGPDDLFQRLREKFCLRNDIDFINLLLDNFNFDMIGGINSKLLWTLFEPDILASCLVRKLTGKVIPIDAVFYPLTNLQYLLKLLTIYRSIINGGFYDLCGISLGCELTYRILVSFQVI